MPLTLIDGGAARSGGEPVKTTCPYCGVGCGVIATPLGEGRIAVAGDPDHPANHGRLCSKGSALAETVGMDGRLLHPMIGDARASWDDALARVADAFAKTIDAHGPDSVAFYVSGQILTEDYYVANKLMKGAIGSANIDTNSRLCMASTVAGHTRAFGADTVPQSYEDLDEADLVVLVGSNFAWCHPVLHQRLLTARERRGTKIVAIDPRETATTDDADLHVAVRTDGDTALFNGLLHALEKAGCVDEAWAGWHTVGLSETLAGVAHCDLAWTARETGVDESTLAEFFRLVAATPRTLTVFSQGVNQSAGGTDKVNAILNTHLATARIGRPGCGPLSATGQPNAMGGREVGGLANQLAAHMKFSDGEVDRVRRFWHTPDALTGKTPRMATQPGLKAVDMFRAVEDGSIKAIWIMGTNPAVSMPEADRVAAALAGCDFVAISEVEDSTDTSAFAHVRLPALAWGEKSGTVTNSERRISRQRPVLAAPGEARADWAIMAEVARRMGYGGFDYANPAEIFAEHCRLTAFENDGARPLDLGALETADYDAFAPTQWPAPKGEAPTDRLYATGGFPTPDRRARLVPVTAPTHQAPQGFTLNTGRVRDHWHTLTRTGRSPTLSRHYAEPYLEINPADADALGLDAAGLARVTSPHGTALLRALLTRRVPRGHVFAPMHWTGQFAPSGRVDALVEGRTDPHSGQPASKSMTVDVQPAVMDWFGFAIVLERPRDLDCAYWSAAKAPRGWRVELAGEGAADAALALIGEPELEWHNPGGTRVVARADTGLLFLAPRPVAVARDWLADAFADLDTQSDLTPLLAGRPGADAPDPGPLVCSCLNVGANIIAGAVAEGACDVAAVGAATGAGTNCGSCRPEIRRLIEAAALQAAE